MSEQVQKWIRIKEGGARRWHAVYCLAYGLQFTYCARTAKLGAELESSERQEVSGKCSCCRSRLRNSFLVPRELQQIRDGTITPIAPKRRAARQNGEITFKQGKLYA